jgi:hypothetical protein
VATTVTGPGGAQYILPGMPAHAYTTFQAVSPRRPATCAEVACARYLHGWVTVVPEGPQADLARSLRGRYQFTETRQPEGLVEFTFPAGQECWAVHSLPWDGRERFFERGGDWRGNPRGDVREYQSGDWVDKFANHQDKLATALERG